MGGCRLFQEILPSKTRLKANVCMFILTSSKRVYPISFMAFEFGITLVKPGLGSLRRASLLPPVCWIQSKVAETSRAPVGDVVSPMTRWRAIVAAKIRGVYDLIGRPQMRTENEKRYFCFIFSCARLLIEELSARYGLWTSVAKCAALRQFATNIWLCYIKVGSDPK